MSWFRRCKHEHVVIAKTYWEGCRGGYTMDFVRQTCEPIILQETTVLIRCEKCGDVQKHLMSGREITP